MAAKLQKKPQFEDHGLKFLLLKELFYRYLDYCQPFF